MAAGDYAMSQRTLRRLTVLALLVLSLGVIGWGLLRIAQHQEQLRRQQAPERNAGELREILAELRATWDSGKAVDEAWQRFEGWMASNIVRGQTTQADIVLYFGRDFHSLDRPPRDGIQTIEYHLYGNNWTFDQYVAFDFDSRSGILQDWHTPVSICGFCPHVLADDGQWRLEGKMLAGRVGRDREGSDTLLLPRLVPQNQRLGVRLANWAPETEYIDQVQLGVVPCEPGCEVDMDEEGRPYLWKESRAAELEALSQDGDGWALSVDGPAAGRVLVLEGRNTGKFEAAMRQAVFQPGAPWPAASLALAFDDGSGRELLPVGTKFLRRIVVPVPPDARTLRISAPTEMWLVRRAWLGHGHMAQDVAWLAATEASGVEADAPAMLRHRDEQRLVLAPMQQVDLRFTAPETALEKRSHQFVLRMWGYYELLPTARESRP
jgi:hypothetical protein